MEGLRIDPPVKESLPGLLTLEAPPSKSLLLRALTCAALAGGGRASFRGKVPDDGLAFQRALRELGCSIDEALGEIRVVRGLDLGKTTPVQIHAGDGAAPARFLLALASTLRREVTITGSPLLQRRNLSGLLTALSQLGVEVKGGPNLPVTVRGPLRGGTVFLAANDTSQSTSALLMVAPLLASGLELRQGLDAVSRPYVDLTRSVMAEFGIRVGADLKVAAGQAYAPAAVIIEPDWSSGTVLLAAAAFLGRRVQVPGLKADSSQPDRRFIDIANHLGLEFAGTDSGLMATGRESAEGTFDVRDCPDAFVALAALAALGKGSTRFTGARHLANKESNRIVSVAALLRAVAVRVREFPDGIEVAGPLAEHREVAAVAVASDHRVAMTAALIGLKTPVWIDDPSCVSKSFPGFFDQWPGVSGRRNQA